MKKLLYLLPIIVLSCTSPTAFMSNGIFSLGTTQSLSKAAVSSGADFVIKKETGKNKIEHFSSKMLKKNCTQENNFKINCN
tara:strand:- start:207 stop:449 length:243 start_codon:yes stop_codon:yes gene_type:complete